MAEHRAEMNSAALCEASAIAVFAAQGPVTVSTSAKGLILYRGKGAGLAVLSVSPAGLALAARKGLIRRQGAEIHPAAPVVASAHTEPDSGGLGVAQAGLDGPARMVAESPLDHLAARRGKTGQPMISRAEHLAGDRLRADFTKAGMMPGIGMRWAGAPSGGRGAGANAVAEQTDAALAARQRVNRALDAVGPELAGLLLDVCCFLKGLELVERERQWPARSAKVLLRVGLAMLARHYNPVSRAQTATRQWGAGDYRPTLEQRTL